MYVIKGEQVHMADARALEQQQNHQAAALLYEKLLQQSPGNLPVIQRLIILYRKLGDIKKELRYIDLAIKKHRQHYSIRQKLNKKATTISHQLNKLLGHTDKKGKPVEVPAEVLKLELRKTRLLKKKPAGR